MRRVVITGMGAVTPIGNNTAELWESLKAGKHGIARITRFDTSDSKAKLAAEVKNFDPMAYMTKGEARKSDLFAQYAIAAATQAMEDSGLRAQSEESAEADNTICGSTANIDPYRLGVCFGSGIGGFSTMEKEFGVLEHSGASKVSPHFISMMIANIAAGKIAIRFGAKASCLPVVTACATGTTAIGEAMRSIRHGYADAVIAGGAEAAVTKLGVAGFVNCMALHTGEDPDAASIPFDARRSGFVMGEGAGALVLEEYEHARARGAKIYAEVSGYGATCDAYHVTAPQPEADGAACAIRYAFTEAEQAYGLAAAGGTERAAIYINAHGTSTQLNDKAETVAYKKAFGEEKARELAISSTKSMTGHMLGAAGAVEAIASIMALREGVVPPTVGYAAADPECDLDYTPNVKREMHIDAAASVSLGFGGHNACVIFTKTED